MLCIAAATPAQQASLQCLTLHTGVPFTGVCRLVTMLHGLQDITRQVMSYGGSATAEMPTLTEATQRNSMPAAPSPGPDLVSQGSILGYSSFGGLGPPAPRLQEADLGSQDIYRSKWDAADNMRCTTESARMHDQQRSPAADVEEDCDSWDDLLSKPY